MLEGQRVISVSLTATSPRWQQLAVRAQRAFGAGGVSFATVLPSRLVATAAEDRLTFAPAHYRGAAIAGGGQTSEAGSLIRLRGASSLRGRDPRVVGSFGVADLACDLGTQARDCPKKS